ncbi:MAG: hypothetical protein M3Z85_12765 [Acidobacteriota bacterium]|nr:hypothetical protein [Acidobacteriota bacterium]
MLKGFYLTVMVGPVVPVPVPQTVLDSLTNVTVTSTSERRTPSGFELTFTLSNKSPLQTIFLLSGGAVIPLMRVVLIATVNGMPEVLIDGVITKQDIEPGANSGHSTLRVTGVDLTAMMDLIDFSGIPYPAMPIEARVALIIAKYAVFGIVPLVIPTILLDVPIPIERIPRQNGKDLQYLYDLADQVGYIFYINSGPAPGLNVAYFGPEVKIGVPQPALNVDMDAHTNVESLSFNFNAEAKTLPIVFYYNPQSKIPIPIPVPSINPLQPPLGLIPPLPLNVKLINDTAKLSPIQVAARGLAEAGRSSDAVTGRGSLDVLRYGRTLKARGLVGVRGVGMAFDGLYFVQSVTHNIKRGEYKQNFTLTRNGLVSITPRVPA